jgi:predicted deoxyguanosinetriphosphate triphosphohydrolase
MLHLEKRSNIESSKAFQRLSEKTQVFFPLSGREQVVKNRMSHSYEVATSAEMIAEDLLIQVGKMVDYKKSVTNVSLLHDIGHPPFGHAGAGLIDHTIRNMGLKEGFDDNNNNLSVIEKNGLFIEDYDYASLIKYPEKLYPSQKEKFLPILEKSIQEDIRHFNKTLNIDEQPKRTVACNIMDEADRNSYIASDYADFFTLQENFSTFEEFFDKLFSIENLFSSHIRDFNERIYQAYKQGDKSKIKSTFNTIKNAFNQNHILLGDLSLGYKSTELYNYRELLGKLEFDCFIKSDYFKNNRQKELNLLQSFIKKVTNEEFYPSKTYSKMINSAHTKEQKLIAIRDMIAEVSDWYVINTMKEDKEIPTLKVAHA